MRERSAAHVESGAGQPAPGLRHYPRLAAVATAAGLLLALLAGRLVYLGTVAAKDISSADHAAPFPLEAPRGALFDRNGALLATDAYMYTVGVSMDGLNDRAAFTAAVAPILGLPEAELRARLADPAARWVSLRPDANPVDAGTAQRLRELHLASLKLEPVRRRYYPLGAAAAHVTGFMNVFEHKAYYGAEGAYDGELAGRPGALGGRVGTDPRGYRPAQAGTDLVLTIDRDLQLAAAKALGDVVRAQEAVEGTVVILDPTTGAILASTSVPSFDPNRYGSADPAALMDPAVTTIYEPGSVMKAMMMAAALDAGVVTENSTYQDTGVMQVGGMTIENFDKTAYGTTTMTELLQHSLNVGAIHLAQLLGQERMYARLAAFGYGAPSGVDLFGEVGGIVHWPDQAGWWAGMEAQNAFGQGISSTPLQVAAAMGAIANDGLLVTPHILAARVMPDGRLVKVQPRPVRQVVSQSAARTTRKMLEAVVAGHVYHAAVPGYSIAGKTGTSQIPIPGGYDKSATIASFCGFLPVDHPRAVILVKVDRPHVPWGSDVAAPVFANMAREVIRVLDLPPDRAVAAQKVAGQ